MPGAGGPTPIGFSDFFTPQSLESGEGGAAPQLPLGPPYGISTECGDAIVGPDEECDDGHGGAPNEVDACTDECQTRDQPGGPGPTLEQPSIDRYLGAGRHPVSGLEHGFITTYVDAGGDEPAVGATLFDIWGKPSHYVTVSQGASPIYDANPVAAALPDGGYAVAWGDFDGDGSDLGVALRRVAADGSLGPLRAANATREFSQLSPDVIWTGSQLVVAWEDYSDAFKGPDLRYRVFDQNLSAVSGDQTLAASPLPEAAVALTSFGESWAAAYREGAADGSETIVLKVGEAAFRIGPISGGPLDDRPALVALDDRHLLVVFSAGTDPALSGVYSVPRLRYAIVDTEGTPTPAFQALDPLDDIFTLDSQVAHLSPALTQGLAGFYVAWRSEARPGDAAGDQLWLRYLTWNASAQQLEVREKEMLVPRVCEASIGDQQRPALARVGLPPWGALAVAWDDYSRSQGAGEPNVVVHYAPTHERQLQNGSVFRETWTVVDGAGWPSSWSHHSTTTAITTSTQAGTGRISTTAAGTLSAWVNRHEALNVDMTATFRVSANGSRVGFMARRADSDDDSYLGVRFNMTGSEPWQIFAVIDDASPTIIATATPPNMWTVYGNMTTHAMRFRVTTSSDGSIALAAKLWVAGLEEPSAWSIEGAVPTTGPLAPIATLMGSRPGRFGFYANVGTGTKTLTLDDFTAKFFEGAHAGDVTANLQPTLPLMRDLAAYRTCTAGAPCAVAEGCCAGDAECAEDSVCAAKHSQFLGLGSHASTCVADHCTNQVLDADEERADCGGVDCEPCRCTDNSPRGTGGYCSASKQCFGGIGDADCTTHADCLPGLLCGQERGWRYGWVQGSDACTANHCFNWRQDGDETGPDCGGSCGSCDCSPSPNGGYQHCTVFCPCGPGEGDCDYQLHCQPGLVCSSGYQWGLGFSTCVAPHCTNKVQDADETGKDCGGADCGPICLP